MTFKIKGKVLGKTCFRCFKFKTIFEFYKHNGMKDGYLNKCKECAKADVRLKHRKNFQSLDYRLKQRKRGRNKYRRLYLGSYSSTTSGSREKWEKRNPHKKKASTIAGNAIRDGRLLRPETCTFSFDECAGRIEAHHCDYSKPLNVLWLCTRHHNIHRKVF